VTTEEAQQEQQGSTPGMVNSISSLFRNGLGLLLNRIELAALEFSEVKGNFARLAALLAFGAIASAFALLGWSALIVVLAWESMGWKILALMAGIYTLLAAILFLSAHKLVARGGLSMRATLQELRADRDALL
jgi:uncharacterized membrane protein YqjE